MRKIYFIGSVLIASVLLVACANEQSSSKSNEDDIVTLSFWNRHPELNETFIDFVDSFEEDNPGIKIDIENIPVSTQAASYQTAVAENNLPDIFDWASAAGSLQELVELDMVKNLDEVFLEEEKEKYYPGTWFENGTTFEHSVYILPLFSPNHNLPMMYYNKNVLEEAGISESELPETWDELIEVGKKIYKNTDGNSYGIVFYNAGWAIESFINAQATAIFSSTPTNMNYHEGKPDYANQGKIESIEFLKTLYDENIIHPSSLEIDTFQAEAEFAAGNAAFYINGNWSGSDITKLDFEDWGVTDIPTKDGKPWYSEAGSASGLAVSNHTEHWEEVKTFLEYAQDHMYSEVIIKSGASQPAKMDVEGSPPFVQFDDIQELMTKNAIPVPKPVERNLDVIDFERRFNEELTIDSIGDLTLGYLTGMVDDLEKELQNIDEEANDLFDELLDETPEISRELFQFPNWEPFTPYLDENYEELK